MNENWCALFIATQIVCTPEQAFEIYSEGRLNKKKRFITDMDVEDMRKLKSEGISYAEIGYMYGVVESTVYYKLKTQGIQN